MKYLCIPGENVKNWIATGLQFLWPIKIDNEQLQIVNIFIIKNKSTWKKYIN